MILQHNELGGKKYSRIISLVPSQTELLFSLGLDAEVIGITKFCVHPQEWFRTKTRIGGTKNINFDKIVQSSPDLIIANKEENVKEQIEELAQRYDVWITDVNNLNDAIKMIVDIGILTGRAKQATDLSLEINEQFNLLNKNLLEAKKIKTAYFIWKDPYMVAAGDTFINDMMHFCGIENIFSGETRYPEITLDEIKERGCELILLSSEPYPFKEKHLEEIQKTIPGIKIILADGEMFSWYGSRLLKSAGYFKALRSYYMID